MISESSHKTLTMYLSAALPSESKLLTNFLKNLVRSGLTLKLFQSKKNSEALTHPAVTLAEFYAYP